LPRTLRTKTKNLLRRLDKNEFVRRRLRIVRNMFTEPLPRNGQLILESYHYRHPQIECRFTVRGKTYTSTVSLQAIAEEDIAAIDRELWNRMVLAVALAMVPFHFLLSDFASVKIKGGALDKATISFYERAWMNGLAEFRYRQGLNPLRPISVVCAEAEPFASSGIAAEEKILMLNGGGKDTAVMVELLKAARMPLTWFSLDIDDAQQRLMEASGVQDALDVDVVLDPEIFRAPTYRWGHMPVMLLLWSVALIPAVARKFKYVTTGNEYSSNEGNVLFKGMDISHQYGKSHDFECELNSFVQRYLGVDVRCFSALRPFHDIQVAQILTRYKRYLGNFVSCNKGAGWCNECPKCAFVFLVLSAFLDRVELMAVFGEDLWAKNSTRMMMRDLMTARVKRWECVGTREECKLAAHLYIEKNGGREFKGRPSMRDLKKAMAGTDFEEARTKYLEEVQTEHIIPVKIAESIVRQYQDVVGAAT
jgi:UDP-N-acetyl-alpha-D-muramoyl-L-alanyl-L-glutamate epimerase